MTKTYVSLTILLLVSSVRLPLAFLMEPRMIQQCLCVKTIRERLGITLVMDLWHVVSLLVPYLFVPTLDFSNIPSVDTLFQQPTMLWRSWITRAMGLWPVITMYHSLSFHTSPVDNVMVTGAFQTIPVLLVLRVNQQSVKLGIFLLCVVFRGMIF